MQAEVKTLMAWADSGAIEGKVSAKPASPQWTDEWCIQPDVAPDLDIPFNGLQFKRDAKKVGR